MKTIIEYTLLILVLVATVGSMFYMGYNEGFKNGLDCGRKESKDFITQFQDSLTHTCRRK